MEQWSSSCVLVWVACRSIPARPRQKPVRCERAVDHCFRLGLLCELQFVAAVGVLSPFSVRASPLGRRKIMIFFSNLLSFISSMQRLELDKPTHRVQRTAPRALMLAR